MMAECKKKENKKKKEEEEEGREEAHQSTPDDAEHVDIFAVNVRFRDAVFESLDREVERYENELLDKDAELKDSQRSREDMGVALGRLRKQLKHLQNAHTLLQSAESASRSEAMTLRQERDSMRERSKERRGIK